MAALALVVDVVARELGLGSGDSLMQTLPGAVGNLARTADK